MSQTWLLKILFILFVIGHYNHVLHFGIHEIDALDLQENGGKKSFSCNSNHQYRVSQCGEHDCSAHKEKNRDYYEYPNFTYFMNEH